MCRGKEQNVSNSNSNQTFIKRHSVIQRRSQRVSVANETLTKNEFHTIYQNRGSEKVRGSKVILCNKIITLGFKVVPDVFLTALPRGSALE